MASYPSLLIIFLSMFSFKLFAWVDGATTMLSDEFIINNPACVITKAEGDRTNLPILAPNITPAISDVFEIEVETQDTFFPSLKRASNITIIGLASFDDDEITLNQLKPSGSEEVVTESEVLLERNDPTYRTFNSKLFFRSKKSADKYPPNLITAETTVTIECQS